MKCPCCGHDEYSCSYIYIDKNNPKKYPLIPELYNGYPRIPCCSECGTIFDYTDLSLREFGEWLNSLDENWQDCDSIDEKRKREGMAIIRYFQLDEILKKSG